MQASNRSAVDFSTKMRAHIALACADVERSIDFYRALLDQAPSKVRDGYAKFEVAEPPLNLTLNYAPAPVQQISPAHFGVQVKSTGEVMTKLAGMTRAGFPARTEEGVGCCFAIQDKAWFVDPDGNHWEVFVVTQADIAEHSRPASAVSSTANAEADPPARDCCAPSCCV
jgi:catechol 2,3-dioxygenase-like lactoylglutathione lyase family enzyme